MSLRKLVFLGLVCLAPLAAMGTRAEGFPDGCDTTSDPHRTDKVAVMEAAIAEHIIELTNAQRLLAGAAHAKLSCETNLRRVAQKHSQDMARRATLSHKDGEGRRPMDRVRRQIPSFQGLVAENIAYRSISVQSVESIQGSIGVNGLLVEQWAQFAMTMWMESDDHRKNMLLDRLTHIGVGVALSGNRIYFTQVFAGPPKGRSYE